MARSDDPIREEEEEIWGTWEDLLLACAVNLHGTHSWDSVSSEVRSRSPSYAHLLTADNCKLRYRHLLTRFAAAAAAAHDEVDADDQSSIEIPWLDELRKLRIAELRQEVQRYDASIGKLQLKVKKLEEERDQGPEEAEGDATTGVDGSRHGLGSDLKGTDDPRQEPPRSAPENTAADRISGECSGSSCKESNSTAPKAEEEVKIENRIEDDEAGDPAAANRSGSGSDRVGGGEAASYNGSSNTIAKGAVRSSASDAANPIVNESVAESKGGEEEEGTKENSDVQSSASLSQRRRRRQPEAEAVSSPVHKAVDVESQPLMAFLEIIYSNKSGSIFHRRLESQDSSSRYGSLIRRHVDLEMVRRRIGRGGYRRTEFFRDLLLLCNNALVFYPKGSTESISAVNLRNLINKEIAATLRRTPEPSAQSAKESFTPPATSGAPPAQLPPSKPKSNPDRVNLQAEKLAPLPPPPPLVACRKRSSISAKPAKKAEKEKEEKPEVEEREEKESEQAAAVDKKSSKQKSAVSRGLRTNKTRGNSGGGPAKNPNPERVPAPAPKAELKEQEPKSPPTSTAMKKKSANIFLNRMKKSPPSSSNGTLLESLKISSKGGDSGSGVGGDQKKKPPPKEESKKESAAVKRSVGRPPKRSAASTPPAPPPPAKRLREDKATPPPLPKKRGRR